MNSFEMLVLLLLGCLGLTEGLALSKDLPEVNMNVSQMIEYNGYPVEEYDVTTSDGYIINIQRIPFGQHGKCKDVTSKPVVFVIHGLLCSSTNWVANLPHQSLGFLLADNCFDVWLGNVRGNTYGLKHVNSTINPDVFWDFSWDNMAKYDLPAMLNFILKITDKPYLYYAAHSQGTMIAFAELSENQELASKVKALFAMGPVATIGYIKGLLKYLSFVVPELKDFFKIFGIHEFLPNNTIMKLLADLICGPIGIRDICADVIFIIDGFDEKQLNKTRLPVYIAHTPAGTSVKNMYHYAQSYQSKKFQKYDYGPDGNLKHYGQETAPLYNLTAYNVPTALYSGGKDWLADPKDVALLKGTINKVVFQSKVIDSWQHLDFIWGLDAATLVYSDIIKHLKKMEGIV